MSAAVVLDASVAVKLVLDEEHRERAQALYQHTIRAGRPVLAPPLVRAEAINAVYQHLRRGDLTPDEARTAVERFLAYPITLSAPDGLYATALDIALTYEVPSIYDATYVAVAQLLDGELWTADKRLLNSLGGRLPWVRAVADYPLPYA